MARVVGSFGLPFARSGDGSGSRCRAGAANSPQIEGRNAQRAAISRPGLIFTGKTELALMLVVARSARGTVHESV